MASLKAARAATALPAVNDPRNVGMLGGFRNFDTATLETIQAKTVARRCRLGIDHARIVAALHFGEVAQ
jgi:hypothetical protein